jgi:hypothetical protein
MNAPPLPGPPVPRRSIVRASAGALVAAASILVAFVLPAEYGIDPIGVGRLTGLSRLAESASATVTPAAGAITAQAESYKTDRVELTLPPKGTVEYKYRLDKGAAMVYAWQATAPVVYDFHTEPEGTASSASQSFEKGESAAIQGSYVAPYNGIHGWYWENPGMTPLTVTLRSAGFYYAATEFLMDGSRRAHEVK